MIDDLASWTTPFTFIPGVGLLIRATAEEGGNPPYLNMLIDRSRYFHKALTALSWRMISIIGEFEDKELDRKRANLLTYFYSSDKDREQKNNNST